MMIMDGFGDCIAGVVERIDQPDIISYDRDKVLNKLISQGMTDEKAVEYFEYNQIGAWVGEQTPCFISPFDKEELNWE